jgi:predicted Zn-dependent peptidase
LEETALSDSDWVPSRIFSGGRLQRQVYHRSVLPNGLRVVTSPRKEAESVAVGIWMGVGARYESARLNGISHFLEHLIFKGTKTRTSRQIKAAVEGVGGVLNAFTDEEFTCLWAKIQPKDLAETLAVLSDMVLNSQCVVKEVNKERQVVKEEIRMYKDLPMQHVHDLLNTLLWPGHPLGRDIAGTEASLDGISRKELLKFQKRYYTPGNIVVAVCGKVSHAQVMEGLAPLWKGIPRGRRVSCQGPGPRQRRPRLRVEAKETEQTHLSLGFHAFPRNHPQVHALSLLNIVLGGNMSSRLFHEVREVRGLAYEIGSHVKRFRDTGLFSVSAGVEHRHLVRCLEVVLKQLKKVRKEGVTAKEFEQAKEYLTGQVLFSLEDTTEHMSWIGECEMLLGHVEPVEGILEQLKTLRKAELTQAARAILRPDQLSLAVIGPVAAKVRGRIEGLLGS